MNESVARGVASKQTNRVRRGYRAALDALWAQPAKIHRLVTPRAQLAFGKPQQLWASNRRETVRERGTNSAMR
jgi:hypothetical protein